MPFCTNCGQQINDGAKFCIACGTEVSIEKSNNQRKTVFEGNIHKCPNCGEVLNSFTANCPLCGYEIRGASNSDAVQKFADQLASAETRHEKVTIIRNFPIPNTKEDILEFMILASANVSTDLEDDLSSAWQSKTEQAYHKAQIVLQDEKELSRIQDIYSQVCSKLTKQKKIEKVKKAGNILAELMPILPNVIIVTGWLISIFILLPLCKINLDNVGTNAFQLLLMIDFIVGAVFIPVASRCTSPLPILITSLGLILSIVVLIPLCGKNLDNVGINEFQLILIIDIICSAVILARIFKQKHKYETAKTTLNSVSFIIALVCVVIMLVVYGIGSITTSEQEKLQLQSTTYEWPSNGLNQYLPLPPSEYGDITTDNDSRFNIEVYQVSSDEFQKYVKDCKEKGFTISTTQTDSIFYAYHVKQYDLSIFYWENTKTMDIYLDAPLEMTKIKWPDNKLVKQIPQPESLIGNIEWDTSEHFGVYIANTTPEQYSKYVDQCIEAGFNVDYSRGKKEFYAYNKKGYYLVVEQHEFDKIYICIKVPEKN